jgi:two-component system, NarL family, sensor kinase
MKSIIFLIALSMLIDRSLHGQVNTDSLRQTILLHKDPEKKAAALQQLGELFRFTNPDSLISVSHELVYLGRINDNLTWQVQGEIQAATYYNLSGNSDTALQIAERNLVFIKGQKQTEPLLITLYSLAGNSLMRLNRQKEALQMFYSCLQTAEKINDKNAQFKAENNIGWAYMELEQYEKAIENFRKCLKTIRENNLPDRYGTIYNNMASCYGSLEKYDSVYKYAAIGIRTATKYNDHAALANGHSIMGTFQAKHKKYQEALSSFEQAVAIREKAGDPFFIVSDLAEISELQSKTGQTAAGISNGEKALAIAREKNIDAKLPMIYSALAHNYEQAGMFEKAAESYKRLNALKDSLYQDANPKALAEIQTLYETVKKEQQIENQQHRIRLQNYLFAGIAVLVLLLGLLAYSFYRRSRLRQETRMKSALIKQQELASKAVMEAEESERQRIAKDLHDSIGQMMSAAKMNLSAFESGIRFESEDQKRSFENVIRLVDESCREVRNVSHMMMPNALVKNNLAAAIHEFVDRLDKKKLEVHVYTEGLDKRLDSNTELVLYRVLQECVHNVIKHAEASTLDITITRDHVGIEATVEDNGTGFDTTQKENFQGMGLRNITTRIEYLKGTVDVDSAPGRGTVIALQVPL